MTEAAHQMTSNVVANRHPGTVGLGIGVEISIRDDKGKEVPKGQAGEVCVRGQNVTKGYWENEKANKESFWEGRWFRCVKCSCPSRLFIPRLSIRFSCMQAVPVPILACRLC